MCVCGVCLDSHSVLSPFFHFIHEQHYKYKSENSLMRSLELSDLHLITKSFFSALDAFFQWNWTWGYGAKHSQTARYASSSTTNSPPLHVFVRIFYLWSISLVILSYLMSTCINTKATTLRQDHLLMRRLRLICQIIADYNTPGMAEWEIIAERWGIEMRMGRRGRVIEVKGSK